MVAFPQQDCTVAMLPPCGRTVDASRRHYLCASPDHESIAHAGHAGQLHELRSLVERRRLVEPRRYQHSMYILAGQEDFNAYEIPRSVVSSAVNISFGGGTIPQGRRYAASECDACRSLAWHERQGLRRGRND
jgi:hypothetical protein